MGKFPSATQKNRDRGKSCDFSPPTPPCIRVRTRRFDGFRLLNRSNGDKSHFCEGIIWQGEGKRRTLQVCRRKCPYTFVLKFSFPNYRSQQFYHFSHLSFSFHAQHKVSCEIICFPLTLKFRGPILGSMLLGHLAESSRQLS